MNYRKRILDVQYKYILQKIIMTKLYYSIYDNSAEAVQWRKEQSYNTWKNNNEMCASERTAKKLRYINIDPDEDYEGYLKLRQAMDAADKLYAEDMRRLYARSG